jgi:predicted permease
MFRQMRALVKDQAELIAVSNAGRIDLTYGSDQDVERAYLQYVSGWMFDSFGIRPALGRVLTEHDDLTPREHPYAVLSHDYWKRRFGQDPRVIGRVIRTGNDLYQIVGVAEGPFTGTEPGTVADIFVPTMMMKNNAIARSDYRWFRTFVKLKPGVNILPVREKLRSAFRAFLEESAKAFAGSPKEELDGYLSQKLLVNPASAGVSGMQKQYGTALWVIGILVTLVLFVCCINVSNLMTAQATARQHEMALRVSIGAGRWRLVQLVIVECAWLGFLAAGIGASVAYWAAPFVAAMIATPENPVRLILPADWRVLGFGVGVAFSVIILFGLAPALRAAGMKPASVLRGGDPHAGPRLMQWLIGGQVAFCVLVLFVAGLLVTTSRRLSDQRTGFSSARLLTLETVTPQPQPPSSWEQVADRLRRVPGIQAAALCEWPLMTGESWNGFISVNGAAPGPIASYFLSVSPGWRELMGIPLLDGRDFGASDRLPGSALVNEAFARQYFGRISPVGRTFEVVAAEGSRIRFQVVGVVGDTRYKDLREPIQPTAYFPFKRNYGRASLVVRTAGQNPLAMAATLQSEVARAGFRVSTIRTQTALVEQHTIRERLLAELALFFGVVVLTLAGIGLYGVLEYSVLQQQREIGIRIAVGAQAGDIAQEVILKVFTVVMAGLLCGIVLGIASSRFLESLLFEVKVTEAGILAVPTAGILAVVVLAALFPVLRAIRTDPVAMLRSE